jgi:hypothetical protein
MQRYDTIVNDGVNEITDSSPWAVSPLPWVTPTVIEIASIQDWVAAFQNREAVIFE